MDWARLAIVTGKGGVGKSALAAAIAVRAVRTGRRVLAIDMSGGRGLATHLGAERLGHDYHEIRSGLFALSIERPAALDEYLRMQVGIPKFARLGPLARAFDVLASTAPGIREIVTMGKILTEVRSEDWDLVVADGPPTGQIGSHLRAPRTISEMVPTGRIREQAEWMSEMLADDTISQVVLVTVPEELPVYETQEAITWIRQSKLIALAPVVTNRVLEPLDFDDSETLEPGPIRDSAVLHMGITAEQQSWLKKIPDGPRLPYLFGTTGPIEVTKRLADHLDFP